MYVSGCARVHVCELSNCMCVSLRLVQAQELHSFIEATKNAGSEDHFETQEGGALLLWFLPPAEAAPPNSIVLCVHGLGCAGRDPNAGGFDQPETRMLRRFGRVVAPDLLGHGGSAVPRGEERYHMRRHAEYLVQLLRCLNAEHVYLIGHSMGGPIALATAEMLQAPGDAKSPRVCALLYSEPNVDGGDCFGSRGGVRDGDNLDAQWKDGIATAHAATSVAEGALWPRQHNLRLANAACCRDLVRESDSGELLPRMQALRGGDWPIPSLCLIGNQNRGLLTSEAALLAGGFPVKYIEDAGHCQHIDNPKDFYVAAEEFFAEATAAHDVAMQDR